MRHVFGHLRRDARVAEPVTVPNRVTHLRLGVDYRLIERSCSLKRELQQGAQRGLLHRLESVYPDAGRFSVHRIGSVSRIKASGHFELAAIGQRRRLIKVKPLQFEGTVGGHRVSLQQS